MEWLLAEAKNKLSEVVSLALTSGPQRIKKRDQAVILLSEDDYLKLIGEKPSFKNFLMEGLSFEGLDLKRDHTPGRDIDL